MINLIKDDVKLNSTILREEGTVISHTPFELKLQLHGEISNPYTFSIKKNYKASATIKVDKPAYTKKSWTTAGTYTFTVPAGVTTIRATIASGGGGGGGGWYSYGTGGNNPITRRYYGGNGGTGQQVIQNISVLPGSTCSVTVGSGGSGGSAYYKSGSDITNGSNGSSGGISKIVVNSATYSAAAGGGGALASSGKTSAWDSGTSYSGGGSKGIGGYGNGSGSAGGSGWVYIEYGGDI